MIANQTFDYKELEQRLEDYRYIIDLDAADDDLLHSVADAIRQQAEMLTSNRDQIQALVNKCRELQDQIEAEKKFSDEQSERIAELQHEVGYRGDVSDKYQQKSELLQSKLSAAQQHLERWEGQEVIEACPNQIAHNAVDYVGSANYRERQNEAHQFIEDAVGSYVASLPDAEGEES